jgi:oxysterol-binding protein-related protein 9/10/11
LFKQIAQAEDVEARAVKVLKWFIATLRGQYSSRNDKVALPDCMNVTDLPEK